MENEIAGEGERLEKGLKEGEEAGEEVEDDTDHSRLPPPLIDSVLVQVDVLLPVGLPGGGKSTVLGRLLKPPRGRYRYYVLEDGTQKLMSQDEPPSDGPGVTAVSQGPAGEWDVIHFVSSDGYIAEGFRLQGRTPTDASSDEFSRVARSAKFQLESGLEDFFSSWLPKEARRRLLPRDFAEGKGSPLKVLVMVDKNFPPDALPKMVQKFRRWSVELNRRLNDPPEWADTTPDDEVGLVEGWDGWGGEPVWLEEGGEVVVQPWVDVKVVGVGVLPSRSSSASPSNSWDFAYSVDVVLECLRRCLQREDHQTLGGGVGGKTTHTVLSFLGLFKHTNLEALSFDAYLEFPSMDSSPLDPSLWCLPLLRSLLHTAMSTIKPFAEPDAKLQNTLELLESLTSGVEKKQRGVESSNSFSTFVERVRGIRSHNDVRTVIAQMKSLEDRIVSESDRRVHKERWSSRWRPYRRGGYRYRRHYHNRYRRAHSPYRHEPPTDRRPRYLEDRRQPTQAASSSRWREYSGEDKLGHDAREGVGKEVERIRSRSRHEGHPHEARRAFRNSMGESRHDHSSSSSKSNPSFLQSSNSVFQSAASSSSSSDPSFVHTPAHPSFVSPHSSLHSIQVPLYAAVDAGEISDILEVTVRSALEPVLATISPSWSALMHGFQSVPNLHVTTDYFGHQTTRSPYTTPPSCLLYQGLEGGVFSFEVTHVVLAIDVLVAAACRPLDGVPLSASRIPHITMMLQPPHKAKLSNDVLAAVQSRLPISGCPAVTPFYIEPPGHVGHIPDACGFTLDTMYSLCLPDVLIPSTPSSPSVETTCVVVQFTEPVGFSAPLRIHWGTVSV